MGKIFDRIDTALEQFIRAQQMYFVATAPLDAGGHVNVSPKGLDTLRVLDPHTLAYLDYVGSGVETIAHLKENGRIVLMLCAFQGPPRIVRFHGRGDVLEPQHPEFATLRALFSPEPAGRAIIRIAVNRIADSCGHGVPLYQFDAHRTQIPAWAQRKGADGIRQYMSDKNRVSLDDLPGLELSEATGQTSDDAE
jgi:hypothetical protein